VCETLPDVTLNSKELKKQKDSCFQKNESQPHEQREWTCSMSLPFQHACEVGWGTLL